MIDRGDLYERADAIGKKAGEQSHTTVYESALLRLVRSKPIVEILEWNNLPIFVGPMKQRGFYVVIREEEPGFVAHIEEAAKKSLDTGTILYPCGFGEYAARLEAATQYQAALDQHKIKSEIIHLPNPGSEEDVVALYVPLFRS